MKKAKSLCPICLLLIAAAARGQEPPRFPEPPGEPGSLRLPTWQYQIVSPLDGKLYTGYMIGTSPLSRGARTTTVPVILVPFIVQFTNTTSGFSTTFDPSTAPDAGCTAGQTAMSLVENSPIFESRPWTLNLEDVGTTQYIDAFQRSNFWQLIEHTGDSWHLLLTYSVGEPLTLPLSYATTTTAAEVRVGVATSCTNATGPGSTNGASYRGTSITLPSKPR